MQPVEMQKEEKSIVGKPSETKREKETLNESGGDWKTLRTERQTDTEG